MAVHLPANAKFTVNYIKTESEAIRRLCLRAELLHYK